MTDKMCICDQKDCNLYLENPITLPCGSTICQDHLTSLKDKFKCSICEDEHLIPENGFQLNRTLLKMINAGIHLNETQRNIIESFKSLDTVVKKYDSFDSETLIYDNFSKLKNKVDLHREKMIEEIHNRSNKIIEQLNQQEKNCKSNMIKLRKINLDQLKNKEIILWKYKLRKPDIELNELIILFDEITKNIENIQNDIEKCESKLMMNKTIEFLPLDDISFGELLIYENKLEISEEYGNCLKSFIGHSNLIKSFELDEKFNRVISGSTDSTIKIWNYETGECIKTLNDHKSWITSIILWNNNQFISGSVDRTIKIWDLNKYECINTLTNESAINNMCLLSSNQLASGSSDGKIDIWNLTTLIKVKTIQAHEKAISCLFMSKKYLISCSEETIKMWNLEAGICSKVLLGHTDLVRCLEIGEQNILFSGSDDKTVKLWDLDIGACIKTINFNGKIFCLKSLTDDLIIIGSSSNSNLVLYDLRSNEIIRKLLGHSNFVSCLKLIENNEYFLSGSKDRTIKLWKL
jgi:WD40 repeat protein